MAADDWVRFWLILGVGIVVIVGGAALFVKVGMAERHRREDDEHDRLE